MAFTTASQLFAWSSGTLP